MAIQRDESAIVRLVLASLGMLYVLKGSVLISTPIDKLLRMPKVASIAFMSIWPGMDPAGFAEDRKEFPECGSRFVRGLVTAYVGIALCVALTVFYRVLPAVAVGWIGIAAILVVVHFGVSDILSSLANLLGFEVGPLFDNPFKSRSLGEFWTARWNRPFVEMDRILFIRPIAKMIGLKRAVFAVFLISGVLHELAISYPAGGGFGGPMLYFAIQGVFVLVERKKRISSRIFTWAVVLMPLPLLFHGPFRERFIVPLFAWLNAELFGHPAAWFFDHGLWVVGVMQLLVLMASFQVPGRLNWKDDLPKLSSFNRKLMWTNGAFIVLTIVSFGVLTLTLHSAFMRGESAALGLAIFITIFWTMRILADCVFYKHEDWPKGPQFVIGHALLDSLFAFLVLGYGSYVAWRLI